MDEWQEVKGNQGTAWDFSKNPVLVGTYVSNRPDVGPNKSMMYTIKLEDGSLTDMWGSASIDMRFRAISFGQKVKIEFRGMGTNPRTKRTFKDFKVYASSMPVEETDISEIPL